MTKHDAVDRLMALATEKRADPVPSTLQVASAGVEVTSPRSSEPESTAAEAGNVGLISVPAVSRGRQILQTIRPLLPAIAGAMRLIDHGAVQAAARLLPLLGGVPGANSPSATTAAATAAQEHFVRGAMELETAYSEIRKQLSGLELHMLAAEEQIARMRTQVERLTVEQLNARMESQKLAQRIRLLTAGAIILLMLIVAQFMVLVISTRG
jgi:hypothetical protein